MTAGAAFDRVAPHYDALWTDAPAGRYQREAVWRSIDPLFQRGDCILDLGCGTGSDAAHLAERGVEPWAIDASAAMVRVARARGVFALCLALEEIHRIAGRFDGALANFGVLNCVPELNALARELGRLIRPGGHLAICVMGPCCAWEIAHYLRRLRPAKAFRRLHPSGAHAGIGVHVWYPGVWRFVRAFRPEFRLLRWSGIGLAVPPSYITGLADDTVARFAAIDRRLAHLPGVRALCDHRLLIFQRI